MQSPESSKMANNQNLSKFLNLKNQTNNQNLANGEQKA